MNEPINYVTVIRRLFLLVLVISLIPAIPALADELGRKELASCNGLAATIIGSPGADVLAGTAGDDVIVGLGGDDVIRSGAGNDTICGGGGVDDINAGPGNDWMSGSGGYDRLRGGAGFDRVSDRLADCVAEVIVGCAAPEVVATTAPTTVAPVAEAPAPVAESIPNLPTCDRAPEWVVEAIYRSFSDTPHVCYFADYISWRESRWTPGVVGGPNRNGTYDYGLLQLNSAYLRTWAGWAGVDWQDWHDPVINAQIARALYDRAGEIWGDPLRPWGLR